MDGRQAFTGRPGASVGLTPPGEGAATLDSLHFLVNIDAQTGSSPTLTIMPVQIFLVAPDAQDAETFAPMLAAALDAADIAALLLPRGERSEDIYRAFAKAIIPLAQDKGCAVLVDNDAALAKALGADGAHLTGGIKAFTEAAKSLKPEMIAGAGNIHFRHDAMQKGEAGADYLFFGALGGVSDPDAPALADWWTETFEIPCVLYAGGGWHETMAKCEFAGLGGAAIWEHEGGPAAALSELLPLLGAAA